MSSAFGATITRLHKIEYSRPSGTPLCLDAAIPAGHRPAPAVIIVHGGGWVRGDRLVDVEPLFRPLENAGIAWFSIDYRLATNVMEFGTAVDDVENAIRFVKDHAAKYRIDPRRIALIGESAGGQLAAMAALNPKSEGAVRAVVAMYTPADLVSLAKESSFVPRQIRDSLAGTPFESLILARLRQLSPIDNVRPGAPPFLLIHGTSDALVPFSQSRQLCERLQASGSSCKLYAVEGGGHGMRWWESSHPREAEAYKSVMIRWLAQQLSASATA